MGQSRSVVVLAAALAAEQNRLFEEGLGEIRATGRQVFPHEALISYAKAYLDEPEFIGFGERY